MNVSDKFRSRNGSALISLLLLLHIVLLFSMMIILSNLHYYSYIKSYARLFQLDLNLISAASLALEQRNFRSDKTSLESLSLFGSDSTTITFVPWGFYSRLEISSHRDIHGRKASFLVSTDFPEYAAYNLILTAWETPLIFSPGCLISGSVLFSRDLQVRSGMNLTGFSIEQTDMSPIRNGLLRDLRMRSKEIYAGFTGRLHSAGEENWNSMIEDYFPFTTTEVEFLKQEASIRRIRGPTELHFKKPITLRNIHFIDRTVLISGSKIIFEETVKGDQILVFAPEIELHQTELSGHFYASRKIILGEDSRLLYPSVVALLCSADPESCIVAIKSNTLLQGALIIAGTGEEEKNSKFRMLNMSSGALVDGLILSDALVEIRGSVRGTLIAPGLYLSTLPAGYINHTGPMELCASSGTHRLLWPDIRSVKTGGYHAIQY